MYTQGASLYIVAQNLNENFSLTAIDMSLASESFFEKRYYCYKVLALHDSPVL